MRRTWNSEPRDSCTLLGTIEAGKRRSSEVSGVKSGIAVEERKTFDETDNTAKQSAGRAYPASRTPTTECCFTI